MSYPLPEDRDLVSLKLDCILPAQPCLSFSCESLSDCHPPKTGMWLSKPLPEESSFVLSYDFYVGRFRGCKLWQKFPVDPVCTVSGLSTIPDLWFPLCTKAVSSRCLSRALQLTAWLRFDWCLFNPSLEERSVTKPFFMCDDSEAVGSGKNSPKTPHRRSRVCLPPQDNLPECDLSTHNLMPWNTL